LRFLRAASNVLENSLSRTTQAFRGVCMNADHRYAEAHRRNCGDVTRHRLAGTALTTNTDAPRNGSLSSKKRPLDFVGAT
jgi:hypothetical protein